jgi:hypothetical protein
MKLRYIRTMSRITPVSQQDARWRTAYVTSSGAGLHQAIPPSEVAYLCCLYAWTEGCCPLASMRDDPAFDWSFSDANHMASALVLIRLCPMSPSKSESGEYPAPQRRSVLRVTGHSSQRQETT